MTELFRLEDLGTTKAAIKHRFLEDYDRPNDDEWSNRVKALLTSRRVAWTLEELLDLIAVFNTPHHQCVLDNPTDFHPLTVASHERLEDKLERWHEYIHQRWSADAPSRIESTGR
jgi:hypothetical protein